MNVLLATILRMKLDIPCFLPGRFISGCPEAPVFRYAGAFIVSMLAILAITAYLYRLLLRFVAVHPVITADSLRDLQHTILPGRSLFGRILICMTFGVFSVVLPLYSAMMMAISYGIYNFSVLWIPPLMWMAALAAFIRFDLFQTKVLYSLPCAGREVYDFSRVLFRSGGWIFRFPKSSGNVALIDPVQTDSEYWRILGIRFHKGMMLERFTVAVACFWIPLGALCLYDPLVYSGNSGIRQYFRLDGTLRREIFSGEFPDGTPRYYRLYFLPDGRIEHWSSGSCYYSCAICDDGKYRIIDIYKDGKRIIYSKKDGFLLLHIDGKGKKVYESPRLKSECPSFCNLVHSTEKNVGNKPEGGAK